MADPYILAMTGEEIDEVHNVKDAASFSVGTEDEADGKMIVGLDAVFQGDVQGRVLGLGKANDIELSTSLVLADLNDLNEPGVYAIPDADTAKRIQNIPNRNAGTVRVWTAAGAAEATGNTARIVQEYINFRGEKWVRYFTNESWSTWTREKSTTSRVQISPPIWVTALLERCEVVAARIHPYVEFTGGGSYADSSVYSDIYYEALPYPMTRVTLTGSASAHAVSVINTNQDGAGGVQFRLHAPAVPPDSVSLRLQLIGQRKEAPEAISVSEPAFSTLWTNYQGFHDIVSLAETYWNVAKLVNGAPARSFTYGKNWNNGDSEITDPDEEQDYGPSYLINGPDGNGHIVCDTLVLMLLRGLNYENSPYGTEGLGIDPSTHEPRPNARFDQLALPANQMGYSWVANLNKIMLGQPTPETYADVLYDGITPPYGDPVYVNGELQFVPGATMIQPDTSSATYRYFAANRRFTYHFAWAWWMQGLIFSDASQVKDGDIAFWADIDTAKPYFDAISHVGLIGIEDGVPYLYEATAYSITESGTPYGGNVIQKLPLADKVPQPSYFARPDYNGVLN